MLGTDPGLQSSGILPNDAGHEALAQAIVEAIEDDRAEPVDTPITPTRTYSSGLTDWASRQVEATRRREAEKREANRPTGTELGGVTQKLDELTQHQNKLEAQQNSLKNAQDAIKQAQEQLKKVVGDQGDQVASLQQVSTRLSQVTTDLQNTTSKLQTIENTVNSNLRMRVLQIETWLENNTTFSPWGG